MKPETKLAKSASSEQDKQSGEALRILIPSYIPERDREILVDVVFFTEAETAIKHKLSHRRIQQIKKEHREVYLHLMERKREVLSALNESVAYAAGAKVREYIVSPETKVGSVSEASLLQSVATQAIKATALLEPKQAPTAPTDWAKLAASTPSSMQPTTTSSVSPAIPPPHKSES